MPQIGPQSFRLVAGLYWGRPVRDKGDRSEHAHYHYHHDQLDERNDAPKEKGRDSRPALLLCVIPKTRPDSHLRRYDSDVTKAALKTPTIVSVQFAELPPPSLTSVTRTPCPLAVELATSSVPALQAVALISVFNRVPLGA